MILLLSVGGLLVVGEARDWPLTVQLLLAGMIFGWMLHVFDDALAGWRTGRATRRRLR